MRSPCQNLWLPAVPSWALGLLCPSFFRSPSVALPVTYHSPSHHTSPESHIYEPEFLISMPEIATKGVHNTACRRRAGGCTPGHGAQLQPPEERAQTPRRRVGTACRAAERSRRQARPQRCWGRRQWSWPARPTAPAARRLALALPAQIASPSPVLLHRSPCLQGQHHACLHPFT